MDPNHPRPAGAPQFDFTPPSSGVTLAHIVYGLQAVALLTALPMFIGVIVNYLTRGQVRDTWLESHYRWQIRTFWYSLLWTVVGTVAILILVGYVVLGITWLWLIYRIVRGWVRLSNGEPMYDQALPST